MSFVETQTCSDFVIPVLAFGLTSKGEGTNRRACYIESDHLCEFQIQASENDVYNFASSLSRSHSAENGVCVCERN